MTKDDKWSFVAGVLLQMRDQTDKMREATSSMLIAPESPLVAPCDTLQDCLISTLSLLIDDDFDSLSWFIFECDYGRSPKKAGIKGNKKLIRKVDDLRWFI